MPKFVLIIGPQAVGKMTVGQELSKLIDYKLFYNHMTIEMVRLIFDYDKKAYEKNIFFTSYPAEYNMRRPCPLGAVGRAHWLAVRPAGRGGNGARPVARPGCPAAPAAGGY